MRTDPATEGPTSPEALEATANHLLAIAGSMPDPAGTARVAADLFDRARLAREERERAAWKVHEGREQA